MYDRFGSIRTDEIVMQQVNGLEPSTLAPCLRRAPPARARGRRLCQAPIKRQIGAARTLRYIYLCMWTACLVRSVQKVGSAVQYRARRACVWQAAQRARVQAAQRVAAPAQ